MPFLCKRLDATMEKYWPLREHIDVRGVPPRCGGGVRKDTSLKSDPQDLNGKATLASPRKSMSGGETSTYGGLDKKKACLTGQRSLECRGETVEQARLGSWEQSRLQSMVVGNQTQPHQLC